MLSKVNLEKLRKIQKNAKDKRSRTSSAEINSTKLHREVWYVIIFKVQIHFSSKQIDRTFVFFLTGWHDINDTQNNLQGQLFIKIKYKP